MKKLFLFTAACALTISANAQSPIASAHIPFPFIAGGRVLPAGDYRFDNTEQSGVLLIDGGSSGSVMVLTTATGPESSSSEARLVFGRRGDQQLLTGIMLPSNPARSIVLREWSHPSANTPVQQITQP